MSIIGDGIMLGAGGVTASISVAGLSETDTVTATNGSKTKAGVWTQTPNPLAHGLPDEYTELEYIQSSGTQYIKTLQRIHFGDEITLDCQLISASNGQCLYGNTNGSDSSGRIFTYANRFCAIFGSTWIAGTDTNANTDANRHTIDVSFSSASTSFVIDGVQYGVKSISDPSTDDMALFRWGSQYAQMKCFGYYHKRNGEDLRCAIPCKRNSGGAIGLYDLVSNAFFGNEGTGVFKAGAEVPQTVDGFLIDKIKDYGTWTVTATDGTNTATSDVVVDSAIEYSVEMSYVSWLYKDGNECEYVTGGWVNGGYNGGAGTFSKDDDHLTVKHAGNGAQLARTSNKIDLTPYNTVFAEVITSTDNYSAAAIRVKATPGYNDGSEGTVTEASKVTVKTIIQTDVSTLSGEYYIKPSIYWGSYAYFYKIWLE